MTDDDRLVELFRTAASDTGAPPPRFDHTDVVAASRRITVRRRAAGVGAAVVLGLVGVGAVALPGGPGSDATSTAAAPLAAPNEAQVRASDTARDQGDGSVPGAAEGPGSALAQPPGAPSGGVSAEGAPLGPGTTRCAQRQDPALRALVEQVLPEAATAAPAPTTDDCRPGGDRYLDLEIDDGATAGVFGVAYLAPGRLPGQADGALAAAAASGGTVVVSSRAAQPGDPAPFADRLPAVLEFLAARL